MDECLDMQSVDLNYGQMFFMMLGFLPVMMCLPCWFVAKFVHEPMVITSIILVIKSGLKK